MSEASDVALRIGELFIRGELLTVEALEDAVRVADKMHLSLGRVLEMNGKMSEHAVNAAIELMNMLDREEIDHDSAVKTLEMVALQGIELETAIRQLRPGVRFIGKKPTNKLGEIMVETGIINPQQLNQGLYNSLNTSLPLGMVLVNTDMVSRSVLESALTALRMMSKGTLSREQAVQALRAARLRQTSFEQSLKDHRFPMQDFVKPFGVGEMLALASVITEAQLLAAREVELEMDTPLEQILVQWGMATPLMIKATEHILGMINQNLLSHDEAAAVVRKLRRARSRDEAAQVLDNIQIALQVRGEIIDVCGLLRLCGFITEADVAVGNQIAQQTGEPLVKTFVVGGLITDSTVALADQCKHFVDTGAIELDQGVIALQYAVEQEMQFAEALDRFGWTCAFAAAK
jgi:hypothetical protein